MLLSYSKTITVLFISEWQTLPNDSRTHKTSLINSSGAYTAETGGPTISVCHLSRAGGVKADWIPHTACWLEKCWLKNMTSWYACHLRKPPVHPHTHTLATYVTTLWQPRSRAPRCGLQPVIGTPPPHHRKTLRDVWRSRCEMWRTSSVMRGFNGGTRLHIWTEWLIHQAGERCGSVDTVLLRSNCHSGNFVTTHSDLKIPIYE